MKSEWQAFVILTVFLADLGHGFQKRVPTYEACRSGSVVQQGTGVRIVCFSDRYCPKGSYCKTGAALGSCCLKRNPCSYGFPYTEKDDAQSCRGPRRIPCPKGYTCQTGDAPLHSVCCPDRYKPSKTITKLKPKVVRVKGCPYGTYFKHIGTRPRCYASRDRCPMGYRCNGNPGVCCKVQNPCPMGRRPYQISGGAPHCFGRNALTCPGSHSCVGSSVSSSVCCPGAYCYNGRPRRYCSRNMCRRRGRCWKYPSAVCVVDNCGRCFTRFYYKGRDVSRYCYRFSG